MAKMTKDQAMTVRDCQLRAAELMSITHVILWHRGAITEAAP